MVPLTEAQHSKETEWNLILSKLHRYVVEYANYRVPANENPEPEHVSCFKVYQFSNVDHLLHFYLNIFSGFN